MADAKHEQKRAGAAAAAAAAVAGGDDMDGDEAPVKLNEDFRNVVIIDNIPQVGAEKYAKLSEFVKRMFAAFGTIVPEGFILPTQGTPAVTCGYAFVEYANADMAARALAEGDNKRFDKDHVLRVTLYSDFDKLVNMSEEYVPPPKPEFEAKSNPNGWLLDREGRDQFLMRFNMFEHKQLRHETHVYWSDPLNRPSAAEGARELMYDGAREKQRGKSWCEMYTAWSPRGTYLATFHHQGIVLWSGDDFQKFGRYAHAGVKVIDFSPCEKYLVTSTYNERQMKDERWVIVWDVVKQTELRTFDAGGTMSWPSFHWSVDDKYLARVAPDVVQVFETPHMGLLEKKSIKVPGVRECQMSPSDNYVSYWVPEREQTTAVVALMALPSRKVVREKHVFFVTDVRMHWQQAGDFLCCKVSRRQKKKAMPTMFLVFRLRAKDVPIEEFEINETIHAFAWDPKGTRFAVAHGDLPGGRTNVSFYNIGKKKVELQKTLEGKTCNGLYWSPAGAYVILAGMGALGGVLEFVDASTATTIVSTDHYQLTDVDWSPCGRYALTSSSQPLDPGPNFKATIENGYKLWNMQGRLLLSKPVETLYQAMWRPRPPSMLTAAQKEEKYLRDKYWDKYAKEDEKRRQSQLSGVEDERRQLKEQWKAMRADHMKDYNEEAPMRVELRGGLLSDEEEDFVTIETVFEEEVSRTEEVISNKDFVAESKAAAAKARAAGRGPAAAAAGADDEDAVAEDD